MENNKNMETNSNLASDKPLHGQELIDAIRAIGIKKPIAHVHKALEKKGLCICYTSVYLAFHGDIFNPPTFEYLSSLGIKHNRSAKKKGRPSERDSKQYKRS
ncbi:hypothetical protein [Leptospira yasudae]|uniref:hypothetical protein n=1 Tax=Leptospira yasudae TaxID=2202201 RepID=UPI0011C36077|nr:hypothetical protein [Leptospira yasudae]